MTGITADGIDLVELCDGPVGREAVVRFTPSADWPTRTP
jgi:hypothetical protein